MANKSNNKVAKDVKKNSKDKRHFMKDFKAELKKVTWPTPKQLFNNTAAVITIVLIIAVIVLVLDLGFEALNNKGINKLRTVVNNTTEQVNNVVVDSSNNESTNAENTSADENLTNSQSDNATENTAE